MRLLPRLLLYLLPVSLLVAGFAHPMTALNQDLGRHLLTGRIILTTQKVPTTNLLSFTYPDFPFINHHWFSEVVFFLTQAVAGFQGLLALSLLLILLACSLVFTRALKQSSPLVATVVSLLYLPILFERTDLRPELFSFLFLAAIVIILDTYRETPTRLIFLLIPIELLWVNSHIYFPIGILLMLLYTLDLAVKERHNLRAKKVLILCGVTIVSGLTTLLNPHVLQGALYPLRVFQNYGYTIEENQTPFFLQSLGYFKPSFPYLEAAIVLLFLFLFLAWKRARLIDWLLAIVLSVVALSAVRNFPLFVFATFIPFARAAQIVISPWLSRVSSLAKHRGLILLSVILLSVTLWQIQRITTQKSFGYGVEEDAKNAVTFFQHNNLHGPIFNNFDIGSYLAYRLYPKEKVFIDGRPEAYPANFIQQTYIKMQTDPQTFAHVSQTYQLNTIIFAHTDQTPWAEEFLQTILLSPDWKAVYLDAAMIILVKNTRENQSVIARFAKPLEMLYEVPLSAPTKDLQTAAHFYTVVQQLSPLERILQELLRRNGNDCRVMGTLLSLYTQQRHPAALILSQQYTRQCQ